MRSGAAKTGTYEYRDEVVCLNFNKSGNKIVNIY